MNIQDFKVIEQFEEDMAKYTGAKYGVTVSSNTNGIFLCLEMLRSMGTLTEGDTIIIPKRTYMSVPMSVINARLKIKFEDSRWEGIYRLKPTPIYDVALRLTKDMYITGTLMVLSFQYRKALPIGRGGMILTDSIEAYNILKKMRFNGRTVGVSHKNDEYIQGWNMYMTPEQAARGLTLMATYPEHNKDIGEWTNYPDLSNKRIFKC